MHDRDEVIGMQLVTQGHDLLIVSEKGMGKRTDINEFTAQNRGGKGVKCYKITEKTGNVIGIKAVDEDDEIMIDKHRRNHHPYAVFRNLRTRKNHIRRQTHQPEKIKRP